MQRFAIANRSQIAIERAVATASYYIVHARGRPRADIMIIDRYAHANLNSIDHYYSTHLTSPRRRYGDGKGPAQGASSVSVLASVLTAVLHAQAGGAQTRGSEVVELARGGSWAGAR